MSHLSDPVQAPMAKSANLRRYQIMRSMTDALQRALFFAYRKQAKHSVDPARHSVTVSECTYSPWNLDEEFLRAYRGVADYTLVDKRKLFGLWEYSRQVRNLDGDYLEVGVWRGGTGCLLAQSIKFQGSNRRIFLCDTFEGMPATDVARDNFYKGGELADTSVDLVRDLASRLGLSNVVLCKGYFPQDTSAQVDSNRFALVHIDVDIYPSARDTVEWIWDKLLPGGVIVFDDYGYSATEGVTRYVDEHFRNRTDAFFVFNLVGHGIVIKRS